MMKVAVVLFTLTLQAAMQAPPGWRETMRKGMDLAIAGKDAEVVALYEKFSAQHPKFAEAQFMLGAAHEQVGRAAVRSGAPNPVALRMKHYELAITHMRRGIEMAGADAPFDWMRGFIDIHGIVGVDRPAEYERLVREAVVRYPADPYAHGYMLSMLATKGQPLDAAAKAARAAIPKTAEARADLAGFVTRHVRDYQPLMPAAGVAAALNEAAAFVDEALKLKPGDARAQRTRTEIAQLRSKP